MTTNRFSLALLVFLLSGCGEADPGGETAMAEAEPEPATAQPHAVPLLTEAGPSEWRLVSISDAVLIPAGIVATIRFEGAEFSGQAPCNRYFGSRNSNPNVPGLFGPVGATRMMCAEEQMDYERQFFEAMGGVREAHIDGDRLILAWETEEDSGELVFVRVLAES
jgi:heat shock protein HslJ